MSTIVNTTAAPDIGADPNPGAVDGEPVARPFRRQHRAPKPAQRLRSLVSELAEIQWATELSEELTASWAETRTAVDLAQQAVDKLTDLPADVAEAQRARLAAARDGKKLPAELDEDVERAKREGVAARAVEQAVEQANVYLGLIREVGPKSVDAVIERHQAARADALTALRAAQSAMARVSATDTLLWHLDDSGCAGPEGRRGSGWFARESIPQAAGHAVPGAIRAGVAELSATGPFNDGSWIRLNAFEDNVVPAETRRALAERGGRNGLLFVAAIERYEAETLGRARSALAPRGMAVGEDDVAWALDCVAKRDLPPVARRAS